MNPILTDVFTIAKVPYVFSYLKNLDKYQIIPNLLLSFQYSFLKFLWDHSAHFITCNSPDVIHS